MSQYTQYPLKFKSPLLDLVKSLPNQAENALQWQNILLGNKYLQREELNLAGVMNLPVQFNEAKITKKALIDYLHKNIKQTTPSLWQESADKYRPHLEGVQMTREKLPTKVAEMFAGFRIEAIELPSFGYRIIKVYFDEHEGNRPRWYAFDHRWKMLFTEIGTHTFKHGFEAGDLIYSRLQEKFKDVTARGNTTNNIYERYSLFGGKNYKEWFVRVQDWPYAYVDKHFDIDNLLFHIRTSEWRDIEQEPVFLIDEIQSDWANDKRHSDEDEFAPMPYFKKWTELAIKTAMTIAVRAGYRKIGFTTAKQHAERYNRKQESFAILYDKEIPKILSKAERIYGGETGWTTLRASHPSANMRYERENAWQMVDKSTGRRLLSPLKNKEIGLMYLKKTAKPALEEVRTFKISPLLALNIQCNDLPLIDWSLN